MSDGLNEVSIPIALSALDQTPHGKAGPVGRIERIKNMAVEKYTPTPGGPSKLRFDPRGAFVGLPTDGRNPDDGNETSLSWSNPELFATLIDQPVSICNSIPRVYNGEDAFIAHKSKRVVTNDLTQSIFHTSDRTLQCPSNAWIAGVTCSVWTETRLEEGAPFTVAYIGFKSDNGAFIRAPSVLWDPGVSVADNVAMVRVCKDGDGERFWVVHNRKGGDRFLRIQVYDIHGELLASTDLTQNAADPGPGFWAITPRTVGGGIFIAQPGGVPDGTTNVNVETSSCEYNGATIDVLSNVDMSIKCSGPLAWATNDLDNLCYLLTHLDGSGKFGYQMTDLGQTHEFSVGGETATDPDSLIGWVRESAVAGEPTLFLGYSMLSPQSSDGGPIYDPAKRWSEVWGCSWVSTGGKIRQMNSVVFVSSAFRHNGEYYAFTYYQSGSGLAITETSETVAITTGDYMIGDRTQKLIVNVGDQTKGSPRQFSMGAPAGVFVSVPLASQSIDGSGTPDSVALFFSSGVSGIPDNTPLLRWTFKNLTNAPATNGGRLRVSGSSIPSADGDWDFIYAESAHVFITDLAGSGGVVPIPGNFTSTGTVEMVSMTTYQVPDINNLYSPETVRFLDSGTVTAVGASYPGNNGTFTIANAYATNRYDLGGQFFRGVRCYTTTQANSGTLPGAITCTPVGPNSWIFQDPGFTDVLSDIGPHKLSVKNSGFLVNGNLLSNDAEYAITDVPALGILETDGIEIYAQIFNAPLPEINVVVPLDVDTYTFKLQSLTLDYRYMGALVVVEDMFNEENNGIYQITFIDIANGTFIAKPVDGRTGQRSESAGSEPFWTITIFFSNGINPVWQPRWFMTPLGNPPTDTDTAHVGRFEDGIAYADWRVEGDDDLPANMFLMGVSDVTATSDGVQVALPYRARSFTAGQPLVTPPNQVAESVAVSVVQSTVGIKTFNLRTRKGESSVLSNELLLPGPLTSVFTQSGFREQGINIAPEAPFIVTQEVTTDEVHQTPGTKHQIVVVFEVTDENGDRIFSVPSPPVDYTLTGDNNSVTYGGRLPIPLDSNGERIANTYGVSNHRILGICIYRTSYQGDLPTIQHYKITSDLSVNGLAPVSAVNGSGFSFPDPFTWQYIDRNPDVNILTSEVLYTDKGFLPRFPAAASRFSCVWMGRPWIVAYDGSVQPGGEKTEGDASWFFPGFRYTFGDDKAVACAPMGNYLIVGCQKSVWYIPAGQFPDSAGRNGTFPQAVRIEKITNGCTGLMLTCDGGVAYSSTSGGIWKVTGNFDNVYLSSDVQDQLSLKALAPTALVIDEQERMHVLTGTAQMFTYDQIVRTWYNWELPSTPTLASLVNVLDPVSGRMIKQLAWQDAHRIAVYHPELSIDDLGGDQTPIEWSIKFAPFTFNNVRGFKHCWAFQIMGEYHGTHNLYARITYPDDSDWAPETLRGPFVPNEDDPYLAEVNPDPEDVAVFGLEFFVDFDGIAEEDFTGESASVEYVSAAVGVESGQSQTTRRIT